MTLPSYSTALPNQTSNADFAISIPPKRKTPPGFPNGVCCVLNFDLSPGYPGRSLSVRQNATRLCWHPKNLYSSALRILTAKSMRHVATLDGL